MVARGGRLSGDQVNQPLAIRAELIRKIWGTTALPSGTPAVTASATPLTLVNTPAGVDKFTSTISTIENYGYHHKLSPAPSKLALLIQGHEATFPPNGIEATCDSLLGDSVDVLLYGMPGRSGNQGNSDHDQYANWSDFKLFVEPMIEGVNQLAGSYSSIYAIGISGGAWTCHVLAAIDPRIDISFPVAGALPTGRRDGGSVGDYEQILLTGWRDYDRLFELAALETGRRQRQILNTNDTC